MLTIQGQPSGRFCDGFSRRDFLKIGGLAMGGLSLPQILRAEAQSGVRKSPKSVIMIYMAGAPPHQDIFDLKMDAPLEIRGPYKPISTKVPGIQISEHMPHCAKIMDKLVPIRSMVGSLSGDHDSHICYTGRSARGVPMPPGGWPSIGSVMTKLCAASGKAVPPFVGLAPNAGHPPYGSPGHPGFLGPACAAFRPNGAGMTDLTLNGITSDRLADRQALLASFDTFRRDVDHSGLMDALDVFDAAGVQRPHLQQAPRGARHLERGSERSASVTARATRRTTATARRATTSTSSSRGDWSRRARVASR